MSGLVCTGGAGRGAARDADLTIRLFGQMEVRVGSAPMARLRSRKGLWLLALLALRAGRSVERSWLAGTLWPDCDEADALRSLRQSLHDLRLALGDEARRVACDSPRTLRLDTAGAHVDVLSFDAATTRGDIESLALAVALRRGPLLEDCGEEWTLEERRRREHLYIDALQSLASAAGARRDPSAAVEYLRLAASADPYREDVQRALMQALGDTGDYTGALLAFRQLRETLWRDLSAAPADATTELFRQLRSDMRKAARPAPHEQRPASASCAVASWAPTSRRRHLPLPLTELIGRDDAVRQVLLGLSRSRLLTLTGTGGVGKTRLALQVAGEAEEEFDAGARFVALAAVGDAGRIGDAIREALGDCHGSNRGEADDSLKAVLSSVRMLLVLDNCEHLSDACAELADGLLRHCPGLRILATSRRPLGLTGETVWRVPSLALPPAAHGCEDRAACSVADLEQYPAIQLFLERAQAAEATFQLTLDNSPFVERICRRLDGIPLAIEMAAARIGSLSVDEIDSRLAAGLGLLACKGASTSVRHKTLAATFSWSWDLLSREEQAVLMRLSVFAAGWSLRAAEAVCAGSGVRGDDVIDLLTSLVDKSLVVYGPAGLDIGRSQYAAGEPRYHLLETVRQFAAERLHQAGDQDEAQDSHRDFYLAWAEEFSPRLRGPEQALWFDRFEVEHPNLRAALDWCGSQGDVVEELRLVTALSRFWDTHGHLTEGRARVDQALGRMKADIPDDLRAAVLGRAGWMAYVQGDHEAARRHHGSALEILRTLDDKKATAGTLNLLAIVVMEDGELALAKSLFEEALVKCQEYGPGARLGSVLQNLGTLAVRMGDYDAGRAYLRRSAEWCEQTGDRQLHALALHDLAAAALQQGHRDEARKLCAESLRLLDGCGAIVDIPMVLDQMAMIAHCELRSGRAARLLGAADALRDSVGAPTPRHVGTQRSDAAAEAQRVLGAGSYAAALAEGRRMGLREMIAYALDDPRLTQPTGEAVAVTRASAGQTIRAGLAADGGPTVERGSGPRETFGIA